MHVFNRHLVQRMIISSLMTHSVRNVGLYMPVVDEVGLMTTCGNFCTYIWLTGDMLNLLAPYV